MKVLVWTLASLGSLLIVSHSHGIRLISDQHIHGLVDQARAIFVDQHAQSDNFDQRLQRIQHKITIYQLITTHEIHHELLSYLSQLIDNYQPSANPELGQPVDHMSDLAPPATDHIDREDTPVKQIDISTYREGDKAITAGKESLPLRELSYTARLEPIILEDLEITANADLSAHISLISLYTSTGQLIATGKPTSDSFTFQSVDILLPTETSYYYITLTPHLVGEQHIGTQFAQLTLTATPTQAKGKITDDPINLRSERQSSDTITITPVRIADISFVEKAEGYTISRKLSDGTVNFSLLQIDADRRDSTRLDAPTELDLIIDEITFTIEDQTAAKTVASSLRLIRLDQGAQTELAGQVDAEKVRFDLTNAPILMQQLESGERGIFLLQGDVILTSNQKGESVRVGLDNLNDGDIIYHSSEPVSHHISALHLKNTSLDLPKLVE